MPQPIARLYSNQSAATAAANSLKERGYSPDKIHVISQSGATGELAQSIEATGVPAAHANIFADRVRQGETLVVVDPPFGAAVTATNLLQEQNPVDVDLPEVEMPGMMTVRDAAAPFSAALGLRVLSSNPAPLSSYFKWRTLKPETASSATLDQVRASSTSAAPFSEKLNLNVLSSAPAPLSSKFGLRVLANKVAPLSEKFGWRMLSDNPAALSSRLNLRMLSNNPAPLSAALGLRVLSNNPAPLSSLFGLRVVSAPQPPTTPPAT